MAKPQQPIIFLNTGWMESYEGIEEKRDLIHNGGQYIIAHEGKEGHEQYNFQLWEDGKYYCCAPAGNKEIKIQRLDARFQEDSVDDITVIITATPKQGGRCIVGWYENAKVYRHWQRHPFREDYGYNVEAKSRRLLPPEDRKFLIAGKWRTSFFGNKKLNASVFHYIETGKIPHKLKRKTTQNSSNGKKSSRRAGAAATTDIEHVRTYLASEKKILPLHNKLQKAFVKFLRNDGKWSNIEEDKDRVDVRFSIANKQHILAEIKPVPETGTVWLAVRFAVGQLLEYRFFSCPEAQLLIVVGCEPVNETINFVHNLDMQIAWPMDSGWKNDKDVEFNFSRLIPKK